ncbi:MAG: GAF domain-containing protein [Rhodospirillales bacterium]|nr:GAF domain-containing protein [Rhodospirillales bacterium]
MKNLILRWLEFCSIGVATTLINSNAAGKYYKEIYDAHSNTAIQNSIPAEFEGVPAWIFTVLFATVAVLLHQKLSRAWYISPGYVSEVQLFCVKYFNDRIHELHKNSIDKFAKDPKVHKQTIISILYAIRRAIQMYSSSQDIRVTLMLPDKDRQGLNQETKLYIRFWANKTKEAPKTLRLGKSFAKGEGFAGYAWKTGVPQVGGKTVAGLVREKRFKKMSEGHESVKSFMAIPVYHEGPDEDLNPILGILCIDAPERFVFPTRKAKLRNFINALKPYSHAIVLHILFHDNLIKASRKSETSPATAPECGHEGGV